MMTREEYEQHKQRLEGQLQEGIALLQAGFRQQLRALEMVWMTTAAEDGVLPRAPAEETSRETVAILGTTAAEPQPAKPLRRPRLEPGQLREDVEAALAHVPRIFDRHHLIKALGYEPDRSSLHRVTTKLIQEGILVLNAYHAGKIPAKYEKTEAVPS